MLLASCLHKMQVDLALMLELGAESEDDNKLVECRDVIFIVQSSLWAEAFRF